MQDNTAFVFPQFLYLFSISGVERDSKPLLALCSFLQQGNLRVLKKRELRFGIWVGYSHQLKTESRLLAQCELHVSVCPFSAAEKAPEKDRQTFACHACTWVSVFDRATWWPFGSFDITGACLGLFYFL